LIILILVLETKKGRHYSVFRSGFWLISILCYIILFRSRTNDLLDDDFDDYLPDYIFFYIKFALMIISFLIEFIPSNQLSPLLINKVNMHFIKRRFFVKIWWFRQGYQILKL
jgi:hypothetical protein